MKFRTVIFRTVVENTGDNELGTTVSSTLLNSSPSIGIAGKTRAWKRNNERRRNGMSGGFPGTCVRRGGRNGIQCARLPSTTFTGYKCDLLVGIDGV